jgi:alpha-1,3-glucan synthase
LESTAPPGQQDTIPIEVHFSAPMDCSSIGSSITITSTTEDGTVAQLDPQSVVCMTVDLVKVDPWNGGLPTAWVLQANLTNVSNGIHVVTSKGAVSQNLTMSTTVRTQIVILAAKARKYADIHTVH